VHFIAKWTSEDIAAEAQSFYVVLQQAMSVIALVGFGWLVPMLGERAYFVAAGFALLGAGLILASLRMRQPETHASLDKTSVVASRSACSSGDIDASFPGGTAAGEGCNGERV
jgi:hypothetical protein